MSTWWKKGLLLESLLDEVASFRETIPIGQVLGSHVWSVVLASALTSLVDALVPDTLESVSVSVTVLVVSGAFENSVAKRLAPSLNLKGIRTSSSVSMASLVKNF